MKDCGMFCLRLRLARFSHFSAGSSKAGMMLLDIAPILYTFCRLVPPGSQAGMRTFICSRLRPHCTHDWVAVLVFPFSSVPRGLGCRLPVQRKHNHPQEAL